MQASDATPLSPVASFETLPLSRVAQEVYGRVKAMVARGQTDLHELDQYEESITVKNSNGVLVFCNEAHRRTFSPKVSPIGRTSHSYLDPAIAQRAESMAELVMAGCPYVEGEHSGLGPDGSIYRMVAHKRSLKDLGLPGMAMMTVVRVVDRSESESSVTPIDLSTSCNHFRELAERDQEICRLTALGVSSRELGERLGMTTRGIELRKQKAFAALGVAKAVDLARLLVRLQDRGFIDLGL